MTNIILPVSLKKEIEAKSAGRKTDKQKMIERVKEKYKKSLYEPGEAVGVVAAQSISEPATQMTMRSYTLASQSDRLSKVTQGLPRLIEIFDARKTFEKSMVIYLTKDKNNKDGAKQVAEKIKSNKVKDLTSSESLNLLEMNIEIDLERKSDRESVINAIKKHMKSVSVVSKGSKVIIKPKSDDIKILKKTKEKVLNLHVSGISGIERVVIVKEKDDWVIQTAGSNLKDIIEVKGVDIARVRTNDIYEVLSVFGIEAARNALLREAEETLGEQGLEVDVRHLMLIADTMAFTGVIKAVGRYGVSGGKSSVFTRANFEETKKHLVEASFHGEIDHFRGFTENIIAGQIAPVGTGFVKLVVDSKKMAAMQKKSVKSRVSKEVKRKTGKKEIAVKKKTVKKKTKK
jgi:DNA-directed RNA polymerase subunit A"